MAKKRYDPNHDGYYNDRIPSDYYEDKKNHLDMKMVRNVALLVVGVLVFLVLVIVVLTMM